MKPNQIATLISTLVAFSVAVMLLHRNLGAQPDCTAPPPAPSNLTLSVLSPYQIRVTVRPGDNLGENFVAQRSTDNGVTFIQVNAGYPNGTFVDSVRLLPSTEFCYKVRAFNGCGVSAYTPIAMSVTSAGPLPNETAPGTPTNLIATVNDNDVDVELSWTPGAFNPVPGQSQQFQVERSTDNFATHRVIQLQLQANMVDSGVTHGTTYYYRVAGVNSFGWGQSPYSNVATATP